MIDSIRRQQINEVLNYDQNMNLQVLNLQKRGVSNMEGAVDLNVLQSQEVIQRANLLINNLMRLLDKKRAEASSLPNYTAAHEQQHVKSIDELARVYEVIDIYNQVISNY